MLTTIATYNIALLVTCNILVAIGKGRGDGHKNSTMSPSQVHTPFRSLTNQVKQFLKKLLYVLFHI